MRSLALCLVIAIACPLAAAQEASPGAGPPPAAAPTPEVAPPPPPTPLTLPRLTITRQMTNRWHRGRVLYGLGEVTGLLGTGLTLASVVVVAVTGYPCDPSDPVHALNPNDPCNASSATYRPPSPTDAAPMLAYLGASFSALGFALTAGGLGTQHSLLKDLGADPGRGPFAGGTTLGVLGFLGVGASYFFGFTNYLAPHDQGIAILVSSLGGTVLCAVGSLLFSIDEARMKTVWERLTTF